MKHEAPAFITPLSITFPMDGRDMTVSAANVATLAAMMDTVAPVLEELVLLPAEMLARLTGDTGPTKADLVDLLQLLQRKAGAQAALPHLDEFGAARFEDTARRVVGLLGEHDGADLVGGAQ
ncbi:MAG: hypothetical protein Q8R98_04280, partial [Rubrivivax sp.]|nr:hypothetical protein [Rubrivivax sp.]